MSGQNLLEYLETLQLEYFSYLFRTKIYELPHYIKMAQDIANLKEEKIRAIGERSGAKHIFTDTGIYDCFYRSIFMNPVGMPNLKYPLDKERFMRYWDKTYAFKADTPVEYEGSLGAVSINFPAKDQCLVNVNGKVICLDYNCLTLKIEL